MWQLRQRTAIFVYFTFTLLRYKIYKAPLYGIGQERQQNVNRQWSHATLKSSVLSLRLETAAYRIVPKFSTGVVI